MQALVDVVLQKVLRENVKKLGFVTGNVTAKTQCGRGF
jgi:hypothetical protein